MTRFLYLAAGLVLGLLAGWLLFGRSVGPADEQADLGKQPGTGGVVAASPMPSPSDADRTDAGGGRIVFRARPAEPSRPQPGPTEPAKEMEHLRFRVAELEKRLVIDDAQTREKQGAPVKPPERLDPRFGQEQVRMAVNAALREVGLDGEATAVDCSEYPCLAVGEIKGAHFGPEASNRLRNSGAFKSYSDDSVQSFGNSIGDNGRQRDLFGVAVYPKGTDAAQRAQIAKRLRYRFDEIQGIE